MSAFSNATRFLKSLIPESLFHFVHHYFKEISVALILAIVAAIIIDPILADHEKRRKTELLQNNLKAVATLEAFDDRRTMIGQGSGFFVTSRGVLVTNYHVIKNAADVVAHLSSGAFYRLKTVRYIDEQTDIAILQFDAVETPSIGGLGNSDRIEVGETVYTLGTPDGLEASFSAGVVSNSSRRIGDQYFIQFTAPISPGSSGGGLFDDNGKVIGVTAAFKSISTGEQKGMDQNLNLAVPINNVKATLAARGVSGRR